MIQTINYEYPSEKINHFIGYGNGLKMVSKYFPFSKNYSETLLLKSLNIVTNSDVKDAFFDIIFYTPNDLGVPTYILNESTITCKTNKGIQENSIDISDRKIRFPKQGFFAVINWKNSESNTSTFTYHRGNIKERFIGSIINLNIIFVAIGGRIFWK